MDDELKIKVLCNRPDELTKIINRIGSTLSPSVKHGLVQSYISFVSQHGMEEAYEVMNGKTIEQILDEYENSARSRPVASGEVDGVHYELFGPPEEGTPETRGEE